MSATESTPQVHTPTPTPTLSPTPDKLEHNKEEQIKKISLLKGIFNAVGVDWDVEEALSSPDEVFNYFKEVYNNAERYDAEAMAYAQLNDKYELFKEKHFTERGWWKRIEHDYIKCKNEHAALQEELYACRYDPDYEY